MRYLLLLLLTAPAYAQSFDHGVASGDPTADSVILWTRLSGALSPAAVAWWIGPHPDGSAPYSDGETLTGGSSDYTVKVDARWLQPATTYYYGFSHNGVTSPVGRTRTAPDGPAPGLRFAVASCANYQDGHFGAYRRLAERDDLAAVLHLGDYIYEHKDGGEMSTERRIDPLHEAVTLDDYRRRYAWYRADADLQAAHAAHPFIIIWDDHEFANNAYTLGATAHDPATEGSWAARVAAAQQAYYEWLPVREPTGPSYRTVSYGDLLDLVLLDTRIEGREDQQGWTHGPVADPSRHIMSDAQFDWTFAALGESTARWRLLVSQVPVFPQLQQTRKTDSWEGFPQDRDRVLGFLRWGGTENTAVVSGDIHSSWAADLPDDHNLYATSPGAASVGVEFVAPGISSRALSNQVTGSVAQATAHISKRNPHVRAVDLEERGYLLLDVDHARLRGEWYFVDVSQPDGGERLGFAYEVLSGETVLAPVPPARAAGPRRDERPRMPRRVKPQTL